MEQGDKLFRALGVVTPFGVYIVSYITSETVGVTVGAKVYGSDRLSGVKISWVESVSVGLSDHPTIGLQDIGDDGDEEWGESALHKAD